MKKITVWILMVVVLGLGGLWWYVRITKDSAPTPLTSVILKLNWRHEAEFAGNYVAIEKGFYKKEGLVVNIEEYNPDGDTAIDALVAGRADFAIAGADEVIKARQAGKFVKSVAVIFKINPAVAFALKSSGIKRPQDFVGKKVGLERGINVDNLYAAMMNNVGIDRSKIKEVSVGYDAKELMNGTVDVSTGWITNEPQLAVQAGYPVNIFLMADYGVNMYADTIVTTDKMIAENPKLVEQFVRGTLGGWQYAIENESEAVDITMKYAKDSTRTHQAYVLSVSIPLINTGSNRLGWMDFSAWSQAQNILFEQKLLSKKIIISDVFTMDFIKLIYKTNE